MESHVGLSRFVYVGSIQSLDQIEYEMPKSGMLSYGKPYRLIFKATETIRGEKTDTVNLVISLQHSTDLDYFRDHHTELMLAASSSFYDEEAEYGIEEQGKVVENARYAFRILKPLPVSGSGTTRSTADQININLDSGRMFGLDLNVLDSRDKILKRAREFALKYKEILKDFWLIVPNEFGVACGYTNAYCGITLLVCPETERTLVKVLKNPNWLAGKVKIQDQELVRRGVLVNTLRSLTAFPSKENAVLVRKLAARYVQLPLQDGQFFATNDVRRTADKLLEDWKL